MARRIVAYFVLACALGAAPALAGSITLDVASPVAVGSPFDVTVKVNDVFDGRALGDVLVGFGFDVTVGNPAVFQYVDAMVGPLFLPLALGTPAVAGIAQNPSGIAPGDFAGALPLATLHFNALQAGSTTIGVTWNSADLNQGLVLPRPPGWTDQLVDGRPRGRRSARAIDVRARSCSGTVSDQARDEIGRRSARLTHRAFTRRTTA